MKYNIELLRFLAVILITLTHTRHDITGGALYLWVHHIPQYGTVILSIISGYLYWHFTRHNETLIRKKFKSLLYPFLIANVVVVLPVLVFYYGFGINFLNRLTFDLSLITQGVFSLSSAPVNPPTYFIRDIFVVFVLIEFAFRKNLYMLLIILPLLLFGELMIRYDILVLFICGALFANIDIRSHKAQLVILFGCFTILSVFYTPEYIKYFVSLLLFILVIDVRIKFRNVGAYSYLLHLYHSPIIVLTYPVLSMYITNSLLSILLQVLISIIGAWVLFLLTRKVSALQILSGGR